jgi:serine/threonine-protein kinase
VTNAPARIGRYRILGLVGQGAMGRVYRGHDDSLERDVAVKVMSLGPVDADTRARFEREAKAAARLQHPNIVTIYELGEHEGSPFMALELLEGIDLQRAIEGGLRPDPKVTLPIVLQVLAGLGHAHEAGIVHRDVKPSNVFLARGRPAKIMDFGVARLAGGATTAGLVVGTPNYMSPEQVSAGEVDGRSDLFSAGLILYELVTGEKAYRGDTVVSLLYKIVHEQPDLGLIPKGPQWEKLNRVLARSLAKDPDGRYRDAHAMGAELAEALMDLGGSPDWMTRSDQALKVRTRSGEPARPAPVPSAPGEPASAPAIPVSPRPSGLLTALAAALGLGTIALLGVAASLMMGPRDRPSPSPASSPRVVASSSPSPTPPPRARPAEPSPAASPSPPPETPPPTPTPAEARLDRANDSMEKGRYAQALAEARAVLARDPNNADARALAGDAEAAILIEECVKKAKAALLAGDRDGALEEIKKGLAVNPSEGRLLALHRQATQ